MHGYDHLDALEEKIVNTKIFLRLRNIKQSATADQTYPSHHVDRFSHSLGVMELAGRIITATFNNTSGHILNNFRKKLSERDDMHSITEKEIPPDCLILNLYAKILPVITKIEDVETLDTRLSTNDYFILETETSSFKPFKTKDTATRKSEYFFIDKKTGNPVPVTRISSIIGSLLYTREKEMQLFVYVVKYDYAESKEWEDVMGGVRDGIIQYLMDLIICGKLKIK